MPLPGQTWQGQELVDAMPELATEGRVKGHCKQ